LWGLTLYKHIFQGAKISKNKLNYHYINIHEQIKIIIGLSADDGNPITIV